MGQVERRLHLHVEHQRVLLGGEVLDPPEVGHGRVVHQDVGSAELRDRLADQSFAVFRLGQVGLDRDRGAAGRADLLGCFADRPGQRRTGRVGGAGDDRDRGALGAEPPGDLRADAPARAGDDRYLAVEQSHAKLP